MPKYFGNGVATASVAAARHEVISDSLVDAMSPLAENVGKRTVDPLVHWLAAAESINASEWQGILAAPGKFLGATRNYERVVMATMQCAHRLNLHQHYPELCEGAHSQWDAVLCAHYQNMKRAARSEMNEIAVRRCGGVKGGKGRGGAMCFS